MLSTPQSVNPALVLAQKLQVFCLALIVLTSFNCKVEAADDFPEVLLQETVSPGRIKFWYSDTTSPTVLHSVSIQPPNIIDLAWRIKGLGDFNRPTPTSTPEVDLLLQYAEGATNSMLGIWHMEGLNRYGASLIDFDDLNAWGAVGAGDFNFDGNSDVLLQVRPGFPSAGMMAVWYLNNNAQYTGFGWINPVYPGGVANSGWTIKAVTDWNSDGHSDIIFQHS